jgi:threonine/homoserine/homoserine lactone efflux protein
MLAFAISLFLLVVTPGPAVLSLAGVGSAFGYRAGIRYLGGLVIGYHLVILTVVSGLASILLAAPWMRNLLLIGFAGYLSFLAFHIAFTGSNIALVTPKAMPGLIAGVGLQLVNPKAYAVNTALISGFSFYADSFVTEIAIKLLIMNMIWIPLHLCWLYLGACLNNFNISKGTQKIINYSMAGSLIIVLLFAFLSLLLQK